MMVLELRTPASIAIKENGCRKTVKRAYSAAMIPARARRRVVKNDLNILNYLGFYLPQNIEAATKCFPKTFARFAL